MPAPSDDALINRVPDEWIASLATLYDRFAHALDPLSQETDEAERDFQQEIASMYDSIAAPKPPLHEFRKGVILRCKRHLIANDKKG